MKSKTKLHPLVNPLIHIVLDRPKIAANIASIIRLSAGLSSVVHICGPSVFDISKDKTRWRAGLDYFAGARVHFHQNIFECLKLLNRPTWLIEVGSQNKPWHKSINISDVIVFGPEDGDITNSIMDKMPDRILSLPQTGPVRSFNLAQCVASVSFEIFRQNEAKIL